MDDISRLLKEGIQALKAGQRERAKALLMQVIEADEENERAWLWLSGAVETDEERRICLENVLTLNPDNELAQKGLARFRSLAEEKVEEEEAKLELPASFTNPEHDMLPEPISEVSLPPSLEARAAQIKGSEPEAEAGWWEEKELIEPATETTPIKKYYDVWSSQEDICAYCAAPIDRLRSHCPQCNHEIVAKVLLNPVPSKHHSRLLIWISVSFFIYLGLLLYNQFFVPLDCLDFGIGDISFNVVGIAILQQVVITVGIYQRQSWVYWLLLIRAFLEAIFVIVLSFDLIAVLRELGPVNFFIAVRDIPCFSFAVVFIFVLLVIVLLNAYIIYMAGEDFKRIPVRRLALVNSRLKDPVMLDRVAQRLSQEGQWASAVLHWQRAVGRASGHAPYLLRLGHAYAELGFYERSLDMLNSALEAVRNSELRHEIEQELVRVTHLSQSPPDAVTQ